MTNIYLRFAIVAIASSMLAWIAMKYFMTRYQYKSEMKSLDLLIIIILASSACGFVGIMLIDGSRFSETTFFYWVSPIAIGSVFGVMGTIQIILSLKPSQ